MSAIDDLPTESQHDAKLLVSRRSSVDEIEARLIQMLGINAFNNGFEVDADFARLCKSVRYLVTQIGITARWCDEDGKEHVEKVLMSTVELMSENGG